MVRLGEALKLKGNLWGCSKKAWVLVKSFGFVSSFKPRLILGSTYGHRPGKGLSNHQPLTSELDLPHWVRKVRGSKVTLTPLEKWTNENSYRGVTSQVQPMAVSNELRSASIKIVQRCLLLMSLDPLLAQFRLNWVHQGLFSLGLTHECPRVSNVKFGCIWLRFDMVWLILTLVDQNVLD